MLTPRLSKQNFWRALLALCAVGLALFLANAGCSSGAVCYRNTDCAAGDHCDHGQCLRLTTGSDSDAEAPSGGGETSGSGGGQ
jgi:hypothetical protein